MLKEANSKLQDYLDMNELPGAKIAKLTIDNIMKNRLEEVSDEESKIEALTRLKEVKQRI